MFFANPVYAVFCFILFILFVIGLLFSIYIEFLGYLLLIIYVGAIAVLFLFTLILLNMYNNLVTVKYNKKDLYYIFALFFLMPFYFYNILPYIFITEFISANSFLILQTYAYILDLNLYIFVWSDLFFFLILILMVLFVGIIGTALVMRIPNN